MSATEVTELMRIPEAWPVLYVLATCNARGETIELEDDDFSEVRKLPSKQELFLSRPGRDYPEHSSVDQWESERER